MVEPTELKQDMRTGTVSHHIAKPGVPDAAWQYLYYVMLRIQFIESACQRCEELASSICDNSRGQPFTEEMQTDAHSIWCTLALVQSEITVLLENLEDKSRELFRREYSQRREVA